MVFGYVAGALFAADIALHFIAIVRGWEVLRCITKGLLMPLLAVTFALLWTVSTSAELPWRVLLGLLAGCSGDIALLDHKNIVGMYIGLSLFSVGHVLYIIQLYRLMTIPAGWLIAAVAIIYLTGLAMIYIKLRPFLPKLTLIPGALYFLLLGVLGVSAALDAFTSFNAGSFVFLGGTLLFLFSDTVLALEIFRGKTPQGNIWIMSPYIAAQTLIAAGFFLRML